MMTRWMLVLILLAGLTGCGQNKGEAEKTASAAGTWDAMDACALLNIGKLSALTGRSFGSAILKPMSPMTDNTAATREPESSRAAMALIKPKASVPQTTPFSLFGHGIIVQL